MQPTQLQQAAVRGLNLSLPAGAASQSSAMLLLAAQSDHRLAAARGNSSNQHLHHLVSVTAWSSGTQQTFMTGSVCTGNTQAAAAAAAALRPAPVYSIPAIASLSAGGALVPPVAAVHAQLQENIVHGSSSSTSIGALAEQQSMDAWGALGALVGTAGGPSAAVAAADIGSGLPNGVTQLHQQIQQQQSRQHLRCSWCSSNCSRPEVLSGLAISSCPI